MINLFEKYKKKRNGSPIGVQSLHNEQTFIGQYNKDIKDFKWIKIKTPNFIKESLKVKTKGVGEE